MKASKRIEEMSIDEILDKKTMDVVAEAYYLIETKGLKQKEIADAVGWEESYLSQILTGYRKNLTLKTIAKLEKAIKTELLVAPVKYRRELRRDIEQLRLFLAAIPDDIKKKLQSELDELAISSRETPQFVFEGTLGDTAEVEDAPKAKEGSYIISVTSSEGETIEPSAIEI